MGLILYLRSFFLIALVSGLFIAWSAFAQSNTNLSSQERDQLTQQLNQLEQEAAQLDQTVQSLQSQSKTLKSEIKLLNSQVKQHEIEIQRLTLVLRQTDRDIAGKIQNIDVTSGKIGTVTKELSSSIREFARQGQSSILEVMLKNNNLSDFFLALNSLEKLQKNIKESLNNLKQYKTTLEAEKADLESFREGQQQARALQEIDRRALAEKKKERDQILADTQGKESIFQDLLKKKQFDIAALKNKLFYLQQEGITPEEAVKYAKLAASRTGIRPALLLGLLEVETGKQFEDQHISVGSNLGTGNWKTDMYDCYINLGKFTAAETQKSAFFQITSTLGLNPDTTPVSRRPNYGCGGAMGPAQFIPTTWLLFTNRVASLIGIGTASPWNVDHAFTAAALFLADAGATLQKKSGEIAAARTYISGKPNCPPRGSARWACIAYGNRVWQLAQEIEQVIGS